ncbi:MAG: 1,4-beta-xylanase [Oscillospiraceae bacterium]|nr:1,4-beta-xylanase [Oscillospiraceae bacterium]
MELNNIKGITFAPFAHKGVLSKKDAFKSLDAIKERTAANFIMLVPCGLQETAQSEIIRYDTEATMSDTELITIIRYAKKLGFNVGLKPTINCKNGVYRAYVSFFDNEVPNEPCWRNWFNSYTEFQMHYAEIAKAENVDMFVCGSEMVMAESREDDWRRLIKQLRRVYSGILTYNTDKYQEDHVTWWDALDCISSSGYYPIDAWEKELDRIEAIVKKHDMPFIFAETGCMSSSGSSTLPHDWSIRSATNVKEQERWYEAMFFAVKKRPWIAGEVLWCWSATPYALKKAAVDWGYDIMGKPAENVVNRYFAK